MSGFPIVRLLVLVQRYHFAPQQTARTVRKGNPYDPAEENLGQAGYREAVRELSRFSDRELSDIGIRRCDIEDIVRRPVAGDRSC